MALGILGGWIFKSSFYLKVKAERTDQATIITEKNNLPDVTLNTYE